MNNETKKTANEIKQGLSTYGENLNWLLNEITKASKACRIPLCDMVQTTFFAVAQLSYELGKLEANNAANGVASETMNKQNTKEIMRSLEDRLITVVNKLHDMKADTIAFEMQNLWDEVNFIRDNDTDFNFNEWRNS